MVFQSDNATHGWDGRYEYNWADLGTYIYTVKYRAKDKKRYQVIQGNVILLR